MYLMKASEFKYLQLKLFSNNDIDSKYTMLNDKFFLIRS